MADIDCEILEYEHKLRVLKQQKEYMKKLEDHNKQLVSKLNTPKRKDFYCSFKRANSTKKKSTIHQAEAAATPAKQQATLTLTSPFISPETRFNLTSPMAKGAEPGSCGKAWTTEKKQAYHLLMDD